MKPLLVRLRKAKPYPPSQLGLWSRTSTQRMQSLTGPGCGGYISSPVRTRRQALCEGSGEGPEPPPPCRPLRGTGPSPAPYACSFCLCLRVLLQKTEGQKTNTQNTYAILEKSWRREGCSFLILPCPCPGDAVGAPPAWGPRSPTAGARVPCCSECWWLQFTATLFLRDLPLAKAEPPHPGAYPACPLMSD